MKRALEINMAKAQRVIALKANPQSRAQAVKLLNAKARLAKWQRALATGGDL